MRYTVKNVTTNYFAENPKIRVGSILGQAIAKNGYAIADLLSACQPTLPIGMSLSHVSPIDFRKQYLNWGSVEIAVGGKIQILTEGIVVLKFSKSLKLPYGQPIYVDHRKNSLVWRKIGPKVGRLIRQQDQDGICDIYVNFGDI